MSTNPVVLDEDTYTEAISLIIERDFFPNLQKIKAQHNYLQAQAHGSLVDLQEAGKTLHDLNSPKKAQQRDAGQSINFYVEDEPEIDKRVNLNLSLDQFQTLYTSEDNASFTDLLEKANTKIKQQNKWFFDRESNQLRITDRPNESSSPLQLIEKAPTGWKYQARNALMYFPQSKSESYINEKDARGAPKSIEYHNTHINSQVMTTTTTKNNSFLAPSDIKAQKGSLTTWNQLTSDGQEGEATPGIRGYNLVDATPTLSPSRVGTPQMTWGSIEGTPLLIHQQGSETPTRGPQFSLPQVSKREQLGMKLSEKASKAYRKKMNEKQRGGIGTPRSGAGLMSPAAQHLLRKSTPALRAQSGFGDALRSSYGGASSTTRSSMLTRRGATPTPIPLFRAGASPATTTSGMIRKKK